MDEETYLQVVAKLQGDSYDSRGELEQAFALLDHDGDNFITAQDLQSSVLAAGLKLSAQEIEVGVVSKQQWPLQSHPRPSGHVRGSQFQQSWCEQGGVCSSHAQNKPLHTCQG